MILRPILHTFTLTLGISLLGGVIFVIAQTAALIAGQGVWLMSLNDVVKLPVCIAASICAVAGFLLSYRRPQPGVVQGASRA